MSPSHCRVTWSSAMALSRTVAGSSRCRGAFMHTLYAPPGRWARMAPVVRHLPVVKFLVLALFYGDHPQLAERCGTTLRALWNTGKADVRIGLNEVSPGSRAILDRLLPGVPRTAADPQIYKYPMMRRLLQEYEGDATHMMWF